jgi:hypothetical protein
MKIYFPERGPDAFLTRKPGASWSSLIIGCFFAGVGGSYLLGNHFISLTIIVLGIGGILVGAAIVTLLNWSKVGRMHSAAARKKASRITSEWRYRPREAIRAICDYQQRKRRNFGCPGSGEFRYKTFTVLQSKTSHRFLKLAPAK